MGTEEARLTEELRERDIVALKGCSLCDGPLMANGLPLFYRVTVERFGVDVAAARRQQGLGMMLGSHILASAMGPDEPMASRLMGPVQMGICESCAADPDRAQGLIESFFERAE